MLLHKRADPMGMSSTYTCLKTTEVSFKNTYMQITLGKTVNLFSGSLYHSINPNFTV